MTSTAQELVLYGVFCHLVDRNVPLGIADYLDGLRALRMGFGAPRADGLGGRQTLRKLCVRLWARSDDEIRLIERLFGDIPLPSDDEVSEVEAALPKSHAATENPVTKFEMVHRDSGRPTAGRPAQPSTSTEMAEAPRVAVHFESRREVGGIPLPQMTLITRRVPETFVLQPQALVSQRSLTVLWRRFRALMRSGPKTEIDIDGTVSERCRYGILADAVRRAPRVNRARLLVLADVSPSMAPWQPFLDALASSLTMSRLRASMMLYFNNVPRHSLFRLPTLTGAVKTDDVFTEFRGASLLVVSDSGAARGHHNYARVEETEEFLDGAAKLLRAIVWINPMPRQRWQGTTAAALSNRTAAAVWLPLSASSLIRAVDILRGAKTA